MHKFKISKSDQNYYGTEPLWVDQYTPKDYTLEITKTLNWYNDLATAKDCREFLKDWFKTDEQKLKQLATIPDKFIPTTYANLARMAMRGFPIDEPHRERIAESINSRATLKEDKVDIPASVRSAPKLRPLATAFIVSEMCDEIEYVVDGEDPRKLDVILENYRITGNQYIECAQKVENIAAEFTELLEARRKKKSELSEDEEQLLENYSNLATLSVIKKIIRVLETHSLNLRKRYTERQKVLVRKKKPKDLSKMVKNLKYLRSEPELGITSLDPTNLLNCSEVWTYDTKTKRISRFFTSISGSITVRGASIVEFNGDMSSSKLLRKPETQLKEFQECAKKDLTSWYSGIKSKPAVVKKRTTDTTLILKVFR